MCVLHIILETDRLDLILSSINLPVYRSCKKGEKDELRKNKIYDYNLISCSVSDKEWDDFEGQINDMISFLNKYHLELQSLKDNFTIQDWQFDIPYYCRLEDNMFVQNDYLPSELLSLSGYFDIGINLSLYPLPTEEHKKTRKKKK